MSIYSFKDQQNEYAAYRPLWSAKFAQYTMDIANLGKSDPVVAFMGAGAGADARAFAGVASKVILVEPNAALLDKARGLISPLFNDRAEFLVGNAMDTGITGKVDLIVAAQSLHTFRNENAAAFKPAGRALNTEDAARRHWQTLLPEDRKARLSVWYYNPDKREESTRVLDRVLKENCLKYRVSMSPFIDAPYFKPAQFQPYIKLNDMVFSAQHMDVDTVRLKEDDVAGWLDSYSFKPDSKEAREATIGALKGQWFNRFAQDGILEVHYKGQITQGPLRRDMFEPAKA